MEWRICWVVCEHQTWPHLSCLCCYLFLVLLFVWNVFSWLFPHSIKLFIYQFFLDILVSPFWVTSRLHCKFLSKVHRIKYVPLFQECILESVALKFTFTGCQKNRNRTILSNFYSLFWLSFSQVWSVGAATFHFLLTNLQKCFKNCMLGCKVNQKVLIDVRPANSLTLATFIHFIFVLLLSLSHINSELVLLLSGNFKCTFTLLVWTHRESFGSLE